MTSLDEDHSLLLDEGMMTAQVRALDPRALGIRAVLVAEGAGKYEDLLPTPVSVWNEALTGRPEDKSRACAAHRMQ